MFTIRAATLAKRTLAVGFAFAEHLMHDGHPLADRNGLGTLGLALLALDAFSRLALFAVIIPLEAFYCHKPVPPTGVPGICSLVHQAIVVEFEIVRNIHAVRAWLASIECITSANGWLVIERCIWGLIRG